MPLTEDLRKPLLTQDGKAKFCRDFSLDFKEWASLFSGKIFMHIVVYADESGTHGIDGEQRGSEVAVVAGIAAKVESWNRFRKDWKAALQRHKTAYFHFNDFAEASAVARGAQPKQSYQQNPYRNWDHQRLDAFLYDMAEIVGAGKKVKLGGYVDTQKYAKFLKENPDEKVESPKEASIWTFYESLVTEIRLTWPQPNWPISVFFDQTGKGEWRNAINKIHHSYKKVEPRIKGICFDDMIDNFPLQAADMVAFRLHQIAGKYCEYDLKIPASVPKLDRLLFREELKSASEFGKLFPKKMGN